MQDEIWKDIIGFEGLYQISNLGAVKSLYKHKKGGLLKPNKDKDGYLKCTLVKDRKNKSEFIHRIACKSFYGENNYRKFVNHINGIKSDNRIENLEWCTQSENQYHAVRIGLQVSKNNNHPMRKKVVVYKNGIEIKVFNGVRVLCNELKLDRRSVQRVIMNKLNHTHGYTFKTI